MDLFKIFFKDDETAVGLKQYRDKQDEINDYLDMTFGFKKQYFKPDYSNNFFLL